MTRTISRIILLTGLLVPLALAAEPSPTPIVVCYSGGPVNEIDANQAMVSMLRVVERVGRWPAQSFTPFFTTKAAECRKLLAERKPGFAMTSLGLYLEQRVPRHLVPLVQPKIRGATSERYRVMIQKGKFKSLDELESKSLGGAVLEEPEFVGRIVFAGALDPASFFVLQPSRQAIRMLRALDKGELDAVILSEQQFAGLTALELKNPVEAVFTSEEIPLMGLSAVGEATTIEERSRFAQALESLCTDGEGKKLCELFGVDAFVAAPPSVFEPMIKLWDRGQ